MIASDTWTSKGNDGETIVHQIVVGRPFPIPKDKNHDWVCPVWIENFTPHIVSARGVGAVDSLMNAMVIVKTFFDMIYKKTK